MLKQGIVTQASLLPNMPHSIAAASVARQNGMPIGLHLNLTEGRPLSSPFKVQSLVGPDGNMLGKLGFTQACKAGTIKISDVITELQEQINGLPAPLVDHQGMLMVINIAMCYYKLKLLMLLVNAYRDLGYTQYEFLKTVVVIERR